MSLLTMGDTHRGTPENIATFNAQRFRTRSHSTISPDDRIRPYFDVAGFRPISTIAESSIDHKFVLALLERWRPETHTFHLPTGECTITLEDVHMLLGLLVDGKAINGCVMQANSLCFQAIGIGLIEGQVGARGQGINLKRLRLYYDQFWLDDASPQETILQKTRCYLLLLIGNVLFPDSTGNTVNFMYLRLLMDFTRVGLYSWGFAVLATVYQSLCKNSKADSCTFYGCALLVQVWGWWRMPILAPVNNESWTFPYALRFCVKKMDFTLNPRSNITMYRTLIDHLGPHQFICRPCLECEYEPKAQDAEIWTTKCCLNRYNIIEMHHSDRVMLQFRMRQRIPDPLVDLGVWHLR
ncbi:protein MAIN-LIKE 1-like [Vicia villosa]|uniref:protein MAIN-LIKE 1-like n=1 Tax=Vicia villosa TaxID=3911 RepID=UPI00273AC17B|nr:protein MAIN-LIKE 1-like [Vicia villosa]